MNIRYDSIGAPIFIRKILKNLEHYRFYNHSFLSLFITTFMISSPCLFLCTVFLLLNKSSGSISKLWGFYFFFFGTNLFIYIICYTKTFFLDHLKSTGLLIVFGAPIVCGLIYIIEWGGEYFWLCTILFFIILIHFN